MPGETQQISMRPIAKLLAFASILAAAAPVIANAYELTPSYAQGGYKPTGDWNNMWATYDRFT